jgi:hypothetical protein
MVNIKFSFSIGFNYYYLTTNTVKFLLLTFLVAHRVKYQVQIETAKKLKNKGLSDAEIAQILEIDLEDLNNNYLE